MGEKTGKNAFHRPAGLEGPDRTDTASGARSPAANSEKSSLALAGEWGMTLAVATLCGALGGYFIGQQLNNKGLSMVLILVGMAGCFTLGVLRMLKITESYVNSSSPSVLPEAHTALGNEPLKPASPGASHHDEVLEESLKDKWYDELLNDEKQD